MREGDQSPSGSEPFEVKRPSHDRILKLMGLLTVVGAIVTSILISPRFGLGIVLGGIGSLLNYYWLRVTLRKFFEKAVDGEKGGMIAARFVLRYLILGGLLFLIFVSGVVPVIAVLFGLAGFALGVVAEGILLIFRPAKVQ